MDDQEIDDMADDLSVAIREREKLRDALRAVIAHYDEHGARTTGMDMVIADCRKLLEEVDA
jgi:hypothetical protein